MGFRTDRLSHPPTLSVFKRLGATAMAIEQRFNRAGNLVKEIVVKQTPRQGRRSHVLCPLLPSTRSQDVYPPLKHM